MDVLILMPLFNDWSSAGELLERLDRAFASQGQKPSVLIIDDGSTQPKDWNKKAWPSLASVSVLKLKTNLGHQRALAVGLSYIAEKLSCDIVLIMDSDGQDEPADAVRLVEKARLSDNKIIVFAQRTRRSESLIFRLSYIAFRALHSVLTGRGIDIGNFSAVPSPLLPVLTLNPMLWNHYAASVMRSRQTFATISTERGHRIDGKSHLNFVALVVHGLQALACYSDIIGVRIIIAASVISVVGVLALLAVFIIGMFTTLAVPGWTSLFAVMTVVLLVQIITLVSNFTIQTISARSVQPFLPARDYAWFVASLERLYPET